MPLELGSRCWFSENGNNPFRTHSRPDKPFDLMLRFTFYVLKSNKSNKKRHNYNKKQGSAYNETRF